MAQECVGSILAVRMRVARLDSAGATPAGSGADTLGNMYVTDALVRLQWDHEMEDGQEILKRNGAGDLCVNHRSDDVYKRLSAQMELCIPDNELTALLTGGSPLITSGQTDGFAMPSLGAAPTPNGVSVEMWSRAIDGDTFAATKPYWWWVFPKMKWRLGTHEANSEASLGLDLVGFGYENPNWGNGPANDWPFASTKAWQRSRTATLPAASCGAQVTPAQT